MYAVLRHCGYVIIHSGNYLKIAAAAGSNYMCPACRYLIIYLLTYPVRAQLSVQAHITL